MRPFSSVLGLTLLAATVPAGGATAQGTDFLFRRPSVTVGARIGYALPRAGSEVFDFTREQLTVDKSDFNALALGGELGVRVLERLDVALGVGFEKSSTRSEFRDWVDDDDLPIEQETRFTRVPVTVGVKAYLLERGRRISRLAWIPEKWAPYLGAGAGIVWYRFEQVGDFVDFDTLEIFFDEFDSEASSPLAYVAAGLDYSLGPRWLVNGEARYSLASAAMGRDFVGFDDIDLNGFRASVGVSVRF
jgi:opacity protein-like surface antigen